MSSVDMLRSLEYSHFLACCGSKKFATEMAAISSTFRNFGEIIEAAREIWFNKVDVGGWLDAFSAHPQIGRQPSNADSGDTHAKRSRGQQSTAMATATSGSLQELADWNAKYFQKFGFVFLICASGKSSSDILDELKQRFSNRPIVEFEIAAQEQMKITELRLRKLFSTEADAAGKENLTAAAGKAKNGEDRLGIIGALLAPASGDLSGSPQPTTCTRPPITTHILDVARGHPAFGVDVRLEIWQGREPQPSFTEHDLGSWTLLGSSTTDKDGRTGQLMGIVDALSAGTYRISFNTSKYNPGGFYPFVSVVFETREPQKFEHFHVPLLLSPFSFSTYRGS